MGSTKSTEKLVVGFVKQIENTDNVDSRWKVSQTRLILSVIVAYLPKHVQFTESLNVGKDMPEILRYHGDKGMYKCCVDSELQLASMEGVGWFGVVDMQQKKMIKKWEKCGDGKQASQWLSIGQQKYLAVQLKANEISMFKVVAQDKSYQFVEDEAYKITVQGTIDYCDFDRDFNHIVLVIDGHILQVRALSNIREIKNRIKSLNVGRITSMSLRCLQLSANGKQCVLSGGNDKPYFYVIDVESGTKKKFKSEILSDGYSPCFINGDTQYVFMGDIAGRMEIWDTEKNEVIHSMKNETGGGPKAAASVHNVLAVGFADRKMRLYDVRTWERFYAKDFNFQALALYLTDDLKYVSFSGRDGDNCVIMKVQ